MPNKPTVAQYAVRRLADLGLRHAFGVPGDFSFPIDDALDAEPRLEFVICSNELNAGYAADGYARVAGAAILCTTHAVGELSVINAVLGSRAEKLPIFHLVGAPSTRLTRSKRHVHHSLGDGRADLPQPISQTTACTSAWLTPANCVAEMERVITEAFEKREPVYIQIAQDFALLPIAGEPITGRPWTEIRTPPSDPSQLQGALDAITERIAASSKPLVFVSFKIGRYGLQDKALNFLSLLGALFVTTGLDKATLSESHPQFLGMYRGELSEPQVLEACKSADLILDLGECVFDDLSTGFGTAHVPLDKVVTMAPNHVVYSKGSGDVQIRMQSFSPVFLGKLLDRLIEHQALAQCVPQKIPSSPPTAPPPPKDPSTLLTYEHIASHVLPLLTAHDLLFVDTGNASVLLPRFRLPADVGYHNQTLWGSIGWATPAAFGAQLALSTKGKGRVVLVTGDGAHQMTANEIGTMGKYHATPLILVLNNSIYGIEEMLDQKKMHAYNKIPSWNYSKVPEAMGCTDWMTAKVRTSGGLGEALERASKERGRAGYVEVMLEGGAKLLEPLSAERLREEFRATF